MSKTIKVDHVVLTLALSQVSLQAGGETKESMDAKINARLAEGFDDVEAFFLRTNYDERQQPTHAVMLYIFKAYQKETLLVPPKAEASDTKKVAKPKE